MCAKEEMFMSPYMHMQYFMLLSSKCMAVHLDDLMYRPLSNEEKQKHCVSQKAQRAG